MRLEVEGPGRRPRATFTPKSKYALLLPCHPLGLFDDLSRLELGYSPSDLRIRNLGATSWCILSVTNPPRSTSRHLESKNARLALLHLNLEDHIDSCVLCPASGRSVFMEWKEDNTRRIFVVDYLSGSTMAVWYS